MVLLSVVATRVSLRFASRTGALALILALGLGSTSLARARSAQSIIDRDAFLSAIAEVETGGNVHAVGRHGERGQYQFRKNVWRQYTTRSFFDAHNPTLSYYVALKHFDWLYDGFLRNGRTPTPYLMAAAWNGGLSRTLSGRLPSSTRSYAQRVSNIIAVTEASSRQIAAIDAPRRFIVPQ